MCSSDLEEHKTTGLKRLALSRLRALSREAARLSDRVIATDEATREDVPQLSTGDSVRHGTLGEGVVTRIEAGGVVTVRFAEDGAERRLMLDYAPLERI